jgi:mycoredoxin
VEKDPAQMEKVIEINNGAKSIPVIVFPDGTHMTEPSDPDLRKKLEELKVI